MEAGLAKGKSNVVTCMASKELVLDVDQCQLAAMLSWLHCDDEKYL